MATYSYLYEMIATGFIDIENIGEVCLSITNNFLQEKILIIHTEYGKTKVIQYGPVYIDQDTVVPTNVSYTYTEFDFNQRKLDNIIDKFINDPKFGTKQCVEIDLDTAKERIIDLREFL